MGVALLWYTSFDMFVFVNCAGFRFSTDPQNCSGYNKKEYHCLPQCPCSSICHKFQLLDFSSVSIHIVLAVHAQMHVLDVRMLFQEDPYLPIHTVFVESIRHIKPETAEITEAWLTPLGMAFKTFQV